MNKLDAKIVYNKPGVAAKAAIVWLHGLGADYNDFVPIVSELDLPFSAKFVFPNAPVIPITINGGMAMRGWYDILDFNDLHREVDTRGINQSIKHVEGILADLIQEGFTADRIVLAGFSQGGVITYYAGLSYSQKLAGLMVLSSYLPDISILDVAKIQHMAGLPILVCHGNQDPVVGISYARNSIQHLQQLGLQYDWHEYPMPHSVCYEEIQDIRKWLINILKGRID